MGVLIVLDATNNASNVDDSAKQKAVAEIEKRDSAYAAQRFSKAKRNGYGHKNNRYRSSDGKREWQKGESEESGANGKFKTLTKVDVNTADSMTLCRIPGLGSKTAQWIIGHRKRLGGFHSVNQLLDIPIVSADLLELFCVEKQPEIQKVNINKASFRQLNMHPYITYEQCKAISSRIRLYGAFADSSALKACGIFSDEELEKLLPYICFE